MYATIRRYSTKTAASTDTIDQFKRRIEQNFLPMLHDVRGFHSYGILQSGDKEIVSLTVFEDRQGATGDPQGSGVRGEGSVQGSAEQARGDRGRAATA